MKMYNADAVNGFANDDNIGLVDIFVWFIEYILPRLFNWPAYTIFKA
jgi:hypothetical protein